MKLILDLLTAFRRLRDEANQMAETFAAFNAATRRADWDDPSLIEGKAPLLEQPDDEAEAEKPARRRKA